MSSVKRTMNFTEMLKVKEFLDQRVEVEEDGTTTYVGAWTDTTVARELGFTPYQVRRVRDELYPNFRSKFGGSTKGKVILSKDKYEKLMDRLDRFAAEHNKAVSWCRNYKQFRRQVETTHDSIEKALEKLQADYQALEHRVECLERASLSIRSSA